MFPCVHRGSNSNLLSYIIYTLANNMDGFMESERIYTHTYEKPMSNEF